MKKITLLISAFVLLGAGCSFQPSISGTTTSGIQGQILIGPSCPVESVPPQAQCAPKGYAGTVQVLSSDQSKEITKFTADVTGNFKVNLAPGDYYLKPVKQNTYPIAQPQSVSVTANSYTKVTIEYDSGIR